MKNWFETCLLTRPSIRRRIWAAALVVCIMVTMMPMQTYAVKTVQTVETMETAGLCEHHTAHTLACGYTEATEGSPCMHLADGKEHTEDCYKMTEVCVHEHTEDCYDTGANLASDSDAEAALNCSHVCSEDSGCMTTELDCPHDRDEHDDSCGYTAGTEGTACSFLCDICNQKPEPKPEQTKAVEAVLALIEELPTMDQLEAMDTEDEGFGAYLEALRAEVQAARAAYEALTEEEKAEFDIAALEKLAALEEVLAAMPVLMVARGIPVLDTDNSYQNVEYNLDVGNEAHVAKVRDTSASIGDNNVLTIPAQVQKNGTTYNVTTILGLAFRDCKNLTEIIVPATVTTIQPYAFSGVGSFVQGTVVKLEHNTVPNTITGSSFRNIKNHAYPLFYIIANDEIASRITETYLNKDSDDNVGYGVFVKEAPANTRFNIKSDSLKMITPGAARAGLESDIGSYDVKGIKDGSDILTTYGSVGYHTYLSTDSTPTKDNMKLVRLPGEGTETYGKNNIWVKADGEFISDNQYLRVTYTLHNRSDIAINNVSLGVRADVQIGKDDMASIFLTSTGLRMVNDYATHYPNEGGVDIAQGMQFTLNCTNAAGADNVDTMWYGVYGYDYSNIFTDLNPKEDFTRGADTVLNFSWKNMEIPANGEITRSVVFGVGEEATPPKLPAEEDKPIALYLTTNGQKDLTVNAKVKDVAGVTNTLYYTINDGAEQTLGEPVTADGTEKVIAGKIAASNFSTNGEYTVKLWIMNSKGAMSEVITKVFTVNGNTISGDGLETGEAPVKPEGEAPGWQDDITGTTDTWNQGGDINSAEELAQFAYNVNNGKDYSGQTITLTAPIDLKGKDWTPIGESDGANGYFSGTFDGNGQTISNLTLSGDITPQQPAGTDPIGYGLFGDVNQATLKNITLDGVNLSPTLKKDPDNATNYIIGAVAGSAKESVVNNCHVSGNVVVSSTDSLGETCVGGVVGNTYNSTIINCSSTGTVGAQDFGSNTVYIGGIVGYAEMYNGGSCVFNSFSTAVLKYENSTGSVTRGGIAGTTFYDNAVNNYATGAVAIGGHNSGTVMYNYNPTGVIFDTGGYPIDGTEIAIDKMTANTGTEGALVDLLNSATNMNVVMDLLADSEVLCAHEDVVPFVWTQTGSDYPTLTETPYTPVLNAEAEWTEGTDIKQGTLAEALAAMAVSGGSIKLLENVSTDNTVVLPAKAIDLDLNGKVWTAENGIEVPSGGALTLMDGLDNGGSITSTSNVGIHNNGKVKLSSGSITGGTNKAAILNNDTLYLSGTPVLTVSADYPNIESTGTIIANDGDLSNPAYFTGEVLVKIPSGSGIDYVAVKGLENEEQANKFTFSGLPTGLEFIYDESSQSLKLATSITKYALTVTDGTITSSDTSGTYEEGVSVTVTANTAPAGAQFKEWTAAGLTNNTYTTNSLTFTMPANAVTLTAKYEAIPTYTITASPTEKDFGSLKEGYTAPPAAQTITITNTGNQTMTLTQPTSTDYTIGTLSSTTIARDATATFTIQPKIGLNEGVYDEVVTINTGNNSSATVAVKFTVTSALVYDLTVNGSYAESNGTGTYEGDAMVIINAGTRSRYTFTGWTSSDGGTFADASSASTTFTMPESNVTITASWRYRGGGSSGGGGGSSSGGSSSGPATPPVQPTVKVPGTGEATITTTVDQNGNANVSVTDKIITDAIADAKKDVPQGQPITVEIKVNTDKAASQLVTTLSQSVRDTLINNQVGSLTIGNKDVSMKFSQSAISQMNAQARGNLIITATKADTAKLIGNAQTLIGNRPTYDFKAICDERTIFNLGINAVTITIPYILKAGEIAEQVQAVRVDANGVATVVPGSHYDKIKQAVVFTTGDVTATYGISYSQVAVPATSSEVIHTVQKGEILAEIAKRYRTTIQDIANLNNIQNPDQLEIGQTIRIPQ